MWFFSKAGTVNIEASGTVMPFLLKVYGLPKLNRTKKKKLILGEFYINRYNKTTLMVSYPAEAEYEYDRL